MVYCGKPDHVREGVVAFEDVVEPEAAMAGGAGTLIGALPADHVDRHRARHIDGRPGHGGAVLWINLRDAAHEKRATEIRSKYAVGDPHVHEVPGPR